MVESARETPLRSVAAGRQGRVHRVAVEATTGLGHHEATVAGADPVGAIQGSAAEKAICACSSSALLTAVACNELPCKCVLINWR